MSFTVLSAEFAHETNTFSIRKTEYTNFMDRYGYFGEEAIKERGEANTELAGFRDVARQHGWKLLHVLSASAEPAGVVVRDAFDRLTNPILAAVREKRAELSGIILGLHGAMVTDFGEDGEGELLRRLREIVGPKLPIAITLDLHANVTKAMCEHANI